MRSYFLAAAVSVFSLTALASPIPIADQLRAEGRSEHEILASLGARHPTPSLGSPDVLSTEIFKRGAEPEAAPIEASALEEEETKAVIEDVIWRTLAGAKRGLEWAGVLERTAEPEADAYEGMEYRQPEYKLRLRV